MIGIYCIKNINNGKVYIGQSCNIENRWKKHKSELNRNVHNNKHLQNAWNMYGADSFEFSVLEECKENEMDDLERKYISLYKATDRRFGYCEMDGGQLHRHHSQESRIKCGIKNIGRKLKPELIENLRRINTGKHLSEEHKKKISESNLGRKNPHVGNNCKPVVCINTQQIFKSCRDAAIWCGLKSTSKIGDCARGVSCYAGRDPITNEKLKWEYA